MRKRILSIFVLAVLSSLAPRRSAAQFIGYTAPQTTSQTLANNIACTGALQSFTVKNIGQSTHVVNWTDSGVQQLNISLLGSFDGTNFSTFSDTAYSSSGFLQATGYYPVVRVDVTCSAGTNITINYSGTPSYALQPNGFADRNTYSKIIGVGLAAGSNQTGLTVTPYGVSAGVLYFQYQSAGMPVGSTLTVTTTSLSGAVVTILNAVTLANNQTLQAFMIPSLPAVQINVTYTAGGASASTYNLEVDYYKPGSQGSLADPCQFGLVSNCSPTSGSAAVIGAVYPLQGPTSNTQTVSAANSPVTRTLSGSAGHRVHLYQISAFCSAGTANLTVTDGGTTVWSTPATAVGTTLFSYTWPIPLAGTTGNSLVITLSTCGVGNTGTLNVQGSTNL